MSDTELAWAAGFFDGEGCSYLVKPTRGNTSAYVRLTVTQKDRRPLDRFMLAVGAGNIHKPDARGIHYWMAGGRMQAEAVMERMWPYLSEPKREQFLQKREKAQTLSANLPDLRGGAKLSFDIAEDIRREYAAGDTTYQMLADKYGVARCMIGHVVRGEQWTERPTRKPQPELSWAV